MINLARPERGLTHEQVIALLSRADGIDRARYAIEIVRDGAPVGTVNYTACTLECGCLDEVKYSASMTLQDDGRIDWTRDMLQIVMEWPHEGDLLRFPFVPLVPKTPTDAITDNGKQKQVEAYDESIYLQDNSLIEPLLLEKGAPYIAAIKSILYEAGFQRVSLPASAKALAADRVFDEGEEIFPVVNTLLSEINYKSIEIGIDGILTSEPYELPSITNARIRYAADRHSIVSSEKTLERDAYKKHNRFKGYVSNPDNAEPLQSVFINRSSASPTSVQNQRGHVLSAPPREFSDAPDQDALDERVTRWAFEVAASYQYATFQTAIMPHHGVLEPIIINAYGVNGLGQETGWSIDFVERSMTHTLRGDSFG